jgi:DNA-directed RNA polymerase sigma subunit (sigma70/sigma32)
MGRKVTTGSRLGLDEPLASDFLDFRAANYSAPEMEVIREALREHIDHRLQEPEMRKRFDEVRRKRLGTNGDKIRLLPTPK